ncbi:MAG TPA: class I tRNA ligase family protein, partial [Chloroflexota bacterium]|nr:class I tRNA ligase family protein [Chloroflexota bacterium]
YWPAMLMSAGIELPKSVAVHGFMTLEGQRISKTTGNIVDPVELAEEFGADAVRYYLMRDVSFESDGDFARANLIQRFNSDLANDLGTLLNRTVSMIGRYFEGVVPGSADGGDEVRQTAVRAAEEAGQLLEEWDFDGALDAIWRIVRRANQYIDESEPWKLARDQEKRGELGTVLYRCADALARLTVLLAPFVPGAAGKMRGQLSLGEVEPGDWARAASDVDLMPVGTTLQKAQPVFPRVEVVAIA